MLEEAPEPKEVSHYHFNQLRSFKIAKENESPPKNVINAIAAASKYGLLFVGMANGFKVLKLEDILDLDRDKDNKNVEENYWSHAVLTEPLVLLSLSCERKTLVVCIWRNSCVVADMYDIGAFADPNMTPAPFLTVPLSGNSSKLNEFMFNPVMDGIYCYCMQDGSLCVHEISGTTLKIVACLSNAGATTVCWSPKGKQLVVGKQNGSFSQYKPTLQEVKNIPAPGLNEKLTVVNICWISTTQFAVLYAPEGRNVSPYLFIVSTHKSTPITYTNFYDVCLGNGNNEDQRYFMHHETVWGILTCASTDSIEVATLGNPPSWVQMELRDDRRALLPAKLGAKHTIGMGVMYCSQRNIIINETEAYPPMPIIFFLTDNGILVPYHMVNSTPDTQSLVHPTIPIQIDKERTKTVANKSFGATSSLTNVNPINPLAPVVLSPASLISSVEATNTASPFGYGQSKVIQRSEPQPQSILPGALFINETPPPKLILCSGEPGVVLDTDRFHKSAKGMNSSTLTFNSGGTRQLAVAQRLSAGNKIECEQGYQNTPILSQGDIRISPQPEKENAQSQNTYLAAINEEIQTFDKEIQDLKTSLVHMNNIGTKEEMTKLKSFTSDFQEFQKSLTETIVSLNSDIHSLKNGLLESFVMVEEANSRERRKNDHSYLSMLRERALDPMTAKRMQMINQHYNYVSTQLQEVSNKLDLDWFEFLQNKKQQKAVHQVSSNEAIYKTVVDNQQTIHTLRKRVDNISKTTSERKNRYLSQRRNKMQFTKSSGPDELSKLADAFLQAKLSTLEEEKPQLSKKMSPETKNMLKKYLSSSSVTQVRPTVVCSLSESRLISKSLLYAGDIAENKFSTPVHENVQPITDQTALAMGLTIAKSGVIIQSDNAGSPPISSIQFNKNVLPNSNMFEKITFAASSLESLILPQPQRLSNGQKSPADTVPMKIPSPSLAFTVPDASITLQSPIYEDITPPDSPEKSQHHSEGNKVLEVSFSHGIPKVQSENISPGFKNISLSLSKEKSDSQGFKQPANSMAINNTQTFATTSIDTKIPNSAQPTTKPSLFAVLPTTTSTPFQVPLPTKDGSSLLHQTITITPISSTQSTSTKPTLDSSAKAPTSNLMFGFNTIPPNVTASTVPVSQPSISSLLSTSQGAPQFTSPLFSFPSTKEASKAKPFSFSQQSTDSAVSEKSAVLSNTININTTSSKLFQNTAKEEITLTKPTETTGVSGASVFQNPQTVLNQNSLNLTPTQKTVVDISKAVKGTSIPTDKIVKTAKEVTTSSFFKQNASSFLPSISTTPAFFNSGMGKTLLGQIANNKSVSPVSTIPSSGATVLSATPKNQISITSITPTTVSDSSSNTVPVSSGSSFQFPKTPNTTTYIPSSDTTTNIVQSSGKTAFSTTLGSLLSNTSLTATTISVSSSSTVSSSGSSFQIVKTPSTVASSAEAQLTVFKTPCTVIASSSGSPTTVFVTPSTIISSSSGSPPTEVFGILNSGASVIVTSSASGQPTTAFGTPSTVVPISTVTPTPDFGSLTSTTTNSKTSTKAFGVMGTTVSSSVSTTVLGESTTTVSCSSEGSTTLFDTPTSSVCAFIQPSTTSSDLVQANFTTALTTSSESSLGQSPSVTMPFSQPVTTTQSSFFAQPSSTQASSSFFGQSSLGQPSFFAKSNTETSSFGSSTVTTSQASRFFSQSSVFGSNSAKGDTAFQETSTFSFGKPAFGQTQGSFGVAKSVFGQTSAFGQLAAQPANSTFGQTDTTSVFGQGSFFSGLGGKPSAEDANKNVFSTGTFGNATNEPSVFGRFSAGSFSSSGGSVVQSGFGAFQQTPQKTGGFGAAPSFGANPAFGSPPTFGSGSPLGAVFGSTQGTQNSNFASFASAASPTFGSLASQNPSGGFGNPPQQPSFGQQSPGLFGSEPVFGGSSTFGSPSLGFGGGASSPPSNTSAFTQWRN